MRWLGIGQSEGGDCILLMADHLHTLPCIQVYNGNLFNYYIILHMYLQSQEHSPIKHPDPQQLFQEPSPSSDSPSPSRQK